MKRTLIIFAAAVFSVSMALTSCQRYEEGPFFSLATKKSRAVNTWVIDRVYSSNGTDITILMTGLFPVFQLELKMDNSYICTWTTSIAETGTWMFDSSFENILTTPSNSSSSTKWRIVRLKSDELWAEVTDGGTMTEYHLKSK